MYAAGAWPWSEHRPMPLWLRLNACLAAGSVSSALKHFYDYSIYMAMVTCMSVLHLHVFTCTMVFKVIFIFNTTHIIQWLWLCENACIYALGIQRVKEIVLRPYIAPHKSLFQCMWYAQTHVYVPVQMRTVGLSCIYITHHNMTCDQKHEVSFVVGTRKRFKRR